jgi:predicted amidophosphoribosyltransferase
VEDLIIVALEIVVVFFELVHKSENKERQQMQEKIKHSCSSCGTELELSYAYCPKCGHPTAFPIEASLASDENVDSEISAGNESTTIEDAQQSSASSRG